VDPTTAEKARYSLYSFSTMATKRKGMEAAIITELAEEGWQWFQRQQKKQDTFAYSCSCGHSWQT
jgi:hypothetical protein